jgi:hypothetical protein
MITGYQSNQSLILEKKLGLILKRIFEETGNVEIRRKVKMQSIGLYIVFCENPRLLCSPCDEHQT